MKQVWILNHYAQEPSRPGGTRHYALAKNMREHGWQASIIAASTELNTGRQRLADGESYRVDMIDGIPFLWLGAPSYQGNNEGRLRNMLTYTARAVLTRSLSRLLEYPDVIIGSSVHPFAAWAGARLARRYKVPFVFEVRDLWPQTLIDMGRMEASSYQARLLRVLEKYLYKRAERIIVLLPHAVDYIAPLGIDSDKVVWIPNGVDISSFPVPPVCVDTETFTLMYFGAHGTANGLQNILEAMAILQSGSDSNRYELRLIGDGPLKPELQNTAKKLELNNVSFDEPVPKSRIPEIAEDADAFIFNLIDAPVFKYGISSNKLYDFMAASRPILFCCNSTNNPVDDAGAGITIPPGDPAALAAGIKRLARLPLDERNKMGRSARNYVCLQHGFDVLAKRLCRMLDDITPDVDC